MFRMGGTTMIVRLLGAASAADAAWQLLDRKGWAAFWGESLHRLRKPTRTARAIAAAELLLGAWLLLRGGRRRVGGDVARFRTSSGHHPITVA
jgi:hypothetical protein